MFSPRACLPQAGFGPWDPAAEAAGLNLQLTLILAKLVRVKSRTSQSARQEQQGFSLPAADRPPRFSWRFLQPRRGRRRR